MTFTSRRQFLRYATNIGVGFAFSPLALVKADIKAKAPPNILLLVTDDQRWDTIAAQGNQIIKTPNLDQLYRQGTVFKKAFVTSSICPVSRASIFTGQYASRHGITGFNETLSKEQLGRTYPAILRKNGYKTGFIGKWGIGREKEEVLALPSRLFDEWHGFPGQGRYLHRDGHLTQKITKKAQGFLRRAKESGKPFCLSISYKAPHAPWKESPSRYANLYSDIQIPLPKSFPSEGAVDNKPEFLKNWLGAKNGRNFIPTLETKVARYYRQITSLDASVGLIRKTLKELGLDQNTIVIFMSDNGMMLGEHGYKGKWLMYEESIRIPMMVYHPGIPQSQGRTRDKMVLNIDVAPTLLELAGIQVPEEMQGASLLPLLKNQKADWRPVWFYEHSFDLSKLPEGASRIPKVEGVRTDRWKYTIYPEETPVYEELFDLSKDPYELKNLSGNPEYTSMLKNLREQYHVLKARVVRKRDSHGK
jgi:arylsulfatase A-like enzyme